MIEVFSYRNDQSLRRTMAEEALNTLLAKHKFSVPDHLILRQQEAVLAAVRTNPDYHVYRVQKDFKQRVHQLAEKQTREALIIDQVAHNDNMAISRQDVRGYLNLTQRTRTKEFIYFNIPSTKLDNQEVPIPEQELVQTCLREKTLNHVIYHLTRE